MANEPYCLAMVLCDAAHQDRTTGKFTLLGTFSTFFAREYPASLTAFVYFAITDGQGRSDIRVRLIDSNELVHTNEDAVFVSPENFVDFKSPLMVLEGFAVMINLNIPKPGLYHCELLANNQLLMARRLLAAEVGEDGGIKND